MKIFNSLVSGALAASAGNAQARICNTRDVAVGRRGTVVFNIKQVITTTKSGQEKSKPIQTLFIRTFFLLVLSCCAAINSQAQHVVVNLLTGQSEQYPIGEIQSIKFAANSMVLYQNNGTVISWDIADIINYEFDLNTFSTTDAALNEGTALKIYPNPSSDRVQIEYSGTERGEILVEILDGSAKQLNVLYRGAHSGRTKTKWDIRSAAVAPGTYLCRVSSMSKVVTGKIIVQ